MVGGTRPSLCEVESGLMVAKDWIILLTALVGYIFGASGLVTKFIKNRKHQISVLAETEALRIAEESKVHLAKITGEVELAKVTKDTVVSERENTGRFQTQLLDRLELLEVARDRNERRITQLEEHNDELLDKLEAISVAHGRLLGEYAVLKQDYDTLRRHVAQLEADNKSMRAKLALVS